MIEFDKLVINNFFSWGEKQTIPLYNQGVTRIEGINKDEPSADSNMAGKTAIEEALLWCLYARTVRGLKHDAVVNRHAKRDCYVSTYFNKDGIHYHVRRNRKHHKHKNRLQLFRASRPIAYRHGDDTQAKLESILGCDYDTFSNTAIFGGTKPFALLTDSEQKRILESFLHFEKFDLALQSTKKSLLRAEEESHELDKKRSNLSENLSGIRGRLGSLTKAARMGADQSIRERKKIKQRLKEMRKVQHARNVSLASLSRESEVAGKVLGSLTHKLHESNFHGEELRQRLEALKKSLRDRKKLIGKPCPVCGRKVASDNMKAFLDHVDEEGRLTRRSLRKVGKIREEFERRVSHAREELKRVQQRLNKRTIRQTKAEALREELQDRLFKLKDKAATPFANEIQSLSKKYSRAMSRLLVCGYEQEMLQARIKDLKFWEEGFGNRGVKALIVREALPAMNQKLKEYAQEIFNGTVRISFSPSKVSKGGKERELFHLEYKSRYGAGSYVGESTGGRKRVDICVLLVFSWLSRTCNVLFCDELLDGLDTAGRESVLGILQSLRGSIFVISHEKELKTHIGKVWTVVKKNGISRLESS